MDPLSAPMYSKQRFEVLCIKNGKSTIDCLPDDLKRYAVETDGAISARAEAAKLAAADGFSVLQPVPPGFVTDVERHARIRASQQSLPKLDKSKV